MAKKKKRRKSGFSVNTMMKYLRLAALVGPAAYDILQPTDPKTKASEVIFHYSGFNLRDGTFHFPALAQGWTPYLMTCLATYGIGKLNGIIRGLG